MAIITIPTIVVVDQLTKWLVWNTYGPAGDLVESERLGGLLRFHFVRNTGSVRTLSGQTGILTRRRSSRSALVVFFYRNRP
ncbi:MAG: hypothetical protein R3A46_17585 [Thermomicrobiales bacterium]